jgi:hypothetical protein
MAIDEKTHTITSQAGSMRQETRLLIHGWDELRGVPLQFGPEASSVPDGHLFRRAFQLLWYSLVKPPGRDRNICAENVGFHTPDAADFEQYLHRYNGTPFHAVATAFFRPRRARNEAVRPSQSERIGYIYAPRFMKLRADCPAWLELAVIRRSPCNER